MGAAAASVGAGAAAYAATRSDGVGDAARSTGKAALAMGAKAQEIDREHHVVDKVCGLLPSLVCSPSLVRFPPRQSHKQNSASLAGLLGQVGQAAKQVTNTVIEVDKKHNISGKVAGGIKKGMDGISSALSK